MNHRQITYLIFGAALILALVFDLGLLSKKGAVITLRKALVQTFFWVILALGFGVFIFIYDGQQKALEYLSAYLMEWSLSIDNIFVFILIFSFLNIHEKFFGRVLLIGILLAVLFRIIFITAGIELVSRFSWLLYIFGAILIYTGLTMFFSKKEEEDDLEKNRVYRFLKYFLPLVPEDGNGKLTVHKNGKKYYTTIFVVIVLLATTDIVFALDSIPGRIWDYPGPAYHLYFKYFCCSWTSFPVFSFTRSSGQIPVPSKRNRHSAGLCRFENDQRTYSCESINFRFFDMYCGLHRWFHFNFC